MTALQELLPRNVAPAQLLDVLSAERDKRLRENRLKHYRPYTKQAAFHAAGLTHRERLFMAGNQLGKTLAGSFEVAAHLTGLYPEWWTGRRFDGPTKWWAAGVTGESTRDNPQRLLVGPAQDPSMRGTGAIPKGHLIDVTAARGVPDALDSVLVKHVRGGYSTLLFKTYVQGREKWQGDTLDGVWFDEEPPLDIYTEGLTRTNATGGLVFMTFTPLLGVSDVVKRFIIEENPDRVVIQMTIEDAEHYTAEERERIIASYPDHEREARAKGIPILGSGRVFPIAEEAITVAPFPVPAHWPQIGAMDFGYDHPFGAVRMAWDRDLDCVYVTAEYRERQTTPVIHAAALRPWGAWLPWAWPHDGLQHDKGSGDQLAAQYGEQGLRMLAERATFDDGTNGVEAGVIEMLDRMRTGRWKVFATCGGWFEEFRLYHRKDGRIVKLGDDLLSASRYGMMMLRRAVCNTPPRPMQTHARVGYSRVKRYG